MRVSEARAIVEATLFEPAPDLPSPLDKQMPFLLKELFSVKLHISDKRSKARTLKAGFAEKSLEWAEAGVDRAIESVRLAIPDTKPQTMSSVRNRMAAAR